MIITKSPFRLSLFGGSSDYKDFFEKHGSFLIGTTIDKFNYLSIRKRPRIMPRKSILTYSMFEEVDHLDQITNPLIRETLKYFKLNFPIECNSFTDIPGRTGLGGSSSYCVGLSLALRKLIGLSTDKRSLANDAITIERAILKEAGGIQDQIWAAYGGFNSIEIDQTGKFEVKPLPVTSDFTEAFEASLLLIYTGAQRFSNSIAKSHENKDKTKIFALAKEAYDHFVKEDIKSIGQLLYANWKEKAKVSELISTNDIDSVIEEVMNYGAYGAKLVGSGGCGFVMVICEGDAKKRIEAAFRNEILDFKFEKDGASVIYSPKHNYEYE